MSDPHPMDCSLPGSSIHGIFQARVLEWGAIAFSIYQLRHRESPRILKWVAYPLHLPDPGIELGSPALLEKAMAPYSSTLAWKIPWMEEPGRLPSMGASLSIFTFMHWRRKWQPTPVFLPGESQGWGSLVGCHLWGRTESDTTEAT